MRASLTWRARRAGTGRARPTAIRSSLTVLSCRLGRCINTAGCFQISAVGTVMGRSSAEICFVGPFARQAD